jgi:acyl carrier protein
VNFESEEEMEVWLVSLLSKALKIDLEEISPTQPVASYGLDSATAAKLTGEIGEGLKLELDPTLFWDYPTIEGLTKHLFEEHKKL